MLALIAPPSHSPETQNKVQSAPVLGQATGGSSCLALFWASNAAEMESRTNEDFRACLPPSSWDHQNPSPAGRRAAAMPVLPFPAGFLGGQTGWGLSGLPQSTRSSGHSQKRLLNSSVLVSISSLPVGGRMFFDHFKMIKKDSGTRSR